MKSEVENLTGHYKKLKIEVPADIVATHFTEYFKELQKEVTLKGFRKGKAPMQLVRQTYADSASDRVLRKIVERKLGEALREHSLSPVSMPQIDVQGINESQPLVFTATFENTPPVELKNYTDYKGGKEPVKVDAEEVEKTLENIRSQLANFEVLAAGTPLARGHFAHMDYEATDLEGKAVPEATEKDSFLEIGGQGLSGDFEKEVLGMTAGETREFNVSFPLPKQDEEAGPLSGRTLHFKTTLKEIRGKNLPEWSDELAKKVGPFADLAELRKRVEDDVRDHKEKTAQRELQEKMIEWLIKENPVDAPETLVNGQLEQLAVDAGMQLSKMGLDQATIETRLKDWGAEMQERATRQVKASMLLSAIAKKENIQAADEDIRQEITRIAQQSNRTPQDVMGDLQKRGLIGGLVKQVTELKALDWLSSRVS